MKSGLTIPNTSDRKTVGGPSEPQLGRSDVDHKSRSHVYVFEVIFVLEESPIQQSMSLVVRQLAKRDD